MREKIGDYLLDISKLVFAGVVLGAILDVGGISQTAVLISGATATIFFAFIGFKLAKK